RTWISESASLVNSADSMPGFIPGVFEDVQLYRLNRWFRLGFSGGQIHRGGTGLGLAIAKECATVHGGDIAVTSQVGAGTCFTVTIPLADAAT
ncbi:MAG: HAMP domain-containing histidine kinase, partial [Betaproteobacteria bacterium]|nr:HAMP domain-containing histidine kinase [Betaproteobacteria bacterium]